MQRMMGRSALFFNSFTHHHGDVVKIGFGTSRYAMVTHCTIEGSRREPINSIRCTSFPTGKARVNQARIKRGSKREEVWGRQDNQDSTDHVHRDADAEEVLESIAARAINHEVGLVAKRRGEAR